MRLGRLLVLTSITIAVAACGTFGLSEDEPRPNPPPDVLGPDGSLPVDGPARADALTSDVTFIPSPEGCRPLGAPATVLAHNEAGFRDAQGGCGWFYMYTPRDGGPGWATMEKFEPADGGRWVAGFDGSILPLLTPTGGHPAVGTGGALAGKSFAVRRWHSENSGNVKVTIEALMPNKQTGDGVIVRVYFGTAEKIVLDLADGALKTGSATAKIAAGDVIDVIIEPRNGSEFDSTETSVLIEAVP